MYIVVGLGNPGDEYKNNLHNLGFMVVDKISEKLGISITKSGFKSMYGIGNVNGNKVMLVKPQTYMNNSGESVFEIVKFYKEKTENVLVIYDDLDIPIGSIRIRKEGSSGTHNGMRSICGLIGNNFPRIRIGSKPKNGFKDIVDYVLSNISKENKEEFDKAIQNGQDGAIQLINGETIDKVMSKYNA